MERPARLAQGQHRLRSEAPVHRRRRHARTDHRRGAEAIPAPAHRRPPRLGLRCASRRAGARRSSARPKRRAVATAIRAFELLSELASLRSAPSRKRHPGSAVAAATPSPRWYAPRSSATARAARLSLQAPPRDRRSAPKPSRRGAMPSTPSIAQSEGASGEASAPAGAHRRRAAPRRATAPRTTSRLLGTRCQRSPRFTARAATPCPPLEAFPGATPVSVGHLGDGNLHYNAICRSATGSRSRATP